VSFTGYTGDIVNTFEANGLAPGSTRAAASSKYPRSKSEADKPDLVGDLANSHELPSEHDAQVDLALADADPAACVTRTVRSWNGYSGGSGARFTFREVAELPPRVHLRAV
jgi:hypothetical protein